MIASALLLAGTPVANAQVTFSDSFDTLDSGVALDSLPQWEIVSGSSYISDGAGELVPPTGAGNITATTASTINWNGEDFTMTVILDLHGSTAANTAGLAFGIKDSNNYYRVFTSAEKGTLVFTGSKDGSSFAKTLYYKTGMYDNSGETAQVDKLSISVAYASTNSEFTVTYTVVSGSRVGETLATTTVTDTTFDSGLFGLFSNYNATIDIDSYSVTVIPESNSFALLLGLPALTFLAWRRHKLKTRR